MKCILCLDDAQLLCLCKSTFLCPKHFGEHILLSCGHPYEILEAISDEEMNKLRKELIKRIKIINSAKSKILDDINKTILMLKSCVESEFLKLDKLKKKYLDLLNIKKVSKTQRKRINNCFGKVFLLKIDENNLINIIEEAFKSKLVYKEDFFNQLNIEEKKIYLDNTDYKIYSDLTKEIKLSKDKKYLFECKI